MIVTFQTLKNLLLLHRSFNHWDREKLETYQRERLVELMKFLGDNSPFYQNYIQGTGHHDFFNLPTIDKSSLMDNFNLINTRGLDRDTLIEFALEQERGDNLGLYQGEYSVGLSSGTSGRKTLTVLDKEERRGYGTVIFLRNGVYGLFRRRVLFAIRTNNPAYMEAGRLGLIKLYFVDYTKSPEAMIQLINDKKLNVLAGPPSLLQLIAKDSSKIDHKIRWVISYAEVLDSSSKQFISNRIRAPVSQIYQGAEGFLAFTCKRGSLHLNEDLIFFEFEPVDPNNPHVVNLIISDLHRRTLPLVRYRMNDIIELSPTTCPCGSTFRVVSRIHGRRDDIFVLLNDSEEKVYLFPDYVRRSINQASDRIAEFQAEQIRPDLIKIRLLYDDISEKEKVEIEREITTQLTRYIQKIGATLPSIEFSEERPEKNPLSGKLIRVIRRFQINDN